MSDSDDVQILSDDDDSRSGQASAKQRGRPSTSRRTPKVEEQPVEMISDSEPEEVAVEDDEPNWEEDGHKRPTRRSSGKAAAKCKQNGELDDMDFIATSDSNSQNSSDSDKPKKKKKKQDKNLTKKQRQANILKKAAHRNSTSQKVTSVKHKLVWAVAEQEYWPGIIIHGGTCGRNHSDNDNDVVVFWPADNRTSKMSKGRTHDFAQQFSSDFDQKQFDKNRVYKRAVNEVLDLIPGIRVDFDGNPLTEQEVINRMKNDDIDKANVLPGFMIPHKFKKHLDKMRMAAKIKKHLDNKFVSGGRLDKCFYLDDNPCRMVVIEKLRDSDCTLEEVCLACLRIADFGEDFRDHPVFEAGCCSECLNELRFIDTLDDNDYCVICASKCDELVGCDFCQRGYCAGCLADFVGLPFYEALRRQDKGKKWSCFVCENETYGQLIPRSIVDKPRKPCPAQHKSKAPVLEKTDADRRAIQSEPKKRKRDEKSCEDGFIQEVIDLSDSDTESDEIGLEEPMRKPRSDGYDNSESSASDDNNGKGKVKCNQDYLRDLVDPPRVKKELNGKRPIRVLSLFDGIASGYFALEGLGFDIAKFYASEIDEHCLRVTKKYFGQKIKHLGCVLGVTEDVIRAMWPIDVVLGGSPCNDFSFVNPHRKDIYSWEGYGKLAFEYARIVNELKLLDYKQGKGRKTYFLFENVPMSDQNRKIISTFLKCDPIKIQALRLGAQRRERLYWSNIEGLGCVNLQPAVDTAQALNAALGSGRQANTSHLMTLTSDWLSNLGAGNRLPVINEDGSEDTLTVDELERIFGFPPHYTDGNFTLPQRKNLLGRTWSVPVIKEILKPLKKYYES